uniref:Uncharacterized protein n=1 Tax=Oryza punctata TaxID=4537 RepID=A0A0E0LZV0_ORYPU
MDGTIEKVMAEAMHSMNETATEQVVAEAGTEAEANTRLGLAVEALETVTEAEALEAVTEGDMVTAVSRPSDDNACVSHVHMYLLAFERLEPSTPGEPWSKQPCSYVPYRR